MLIDAPIVDRKLLFASERLDNKRTGKKNGGQGYPREASMNCPGCKRPLSIREMLDPRPACTLSAFVGWSCPMCGPILKPWPKAGRVFPHLLDKPRIFLERVEAKDA